MKCLIIDAVHSAIAEELGKYMQVDTHMLPTQEELVKLIPDYDVLIMRVDPKITKEIIDAAANLKVIGVCSVGLNHVDMDACKAKGVQVFNAPGLNANAVAELTFSKMLDLSRHTIPANYDVKVNKTWDKYKFVGRELRGKTLGILGFGRIGQRVGELGRAFKMNIVAYDPYLPAHVFEEQQATSMGIDELLKVSDFVTIHMPLTPETKDLFNAKSLAEMKDDAVVLNMARGGIVNEQDMYEALKAGKIGGYASDVMENELAAGGLTEGKKICDMAHIYDIPVQMHICGGPIATAAALQLEAAIPNYLIHEHHAAALLDENIRSCKYDYQPVNGYFDVPDLPGIGQELSDEALETAEITTLC